MKILILLKNGLCTDEAGRALQTADDMLTQDHTVSLFLLQEAVRFCQPRTDCADTARLQKLISKNLQVNVLTADAELRGIDVAAADPAVKNGSYDALVDLITSSDRVVGIL